MPWISSVIAKTCPVVACALTLVLFLHEGPPPALALDVPVLKGRVNDLANILSPATESQLEQYLAQLERSDSTQLAVLTINSLEGNNLEQFSLQVAESWQIGEAGLDSGALLLIAVRDRKMLIEVGYGLEGTLTDLTCGRIIRNVIRPRFQQGSFDQGVIDGVTAMAQAVRGEFKASQAKDRNKLDDPFGMIAALMFFFFFIGNLLRRNKLASAMAGGIGAPIVGTLFHGFSWPLFAGLIPLGIILGLIATKMHMHAGRPGRTFTTYGGGGFRSSSGGFGGFSGGGGGFGGGGASGGW